MNSNTDIIKKYFPGITPRQEEQFAMLGKLYPYWNERINVISRKDIGNLYEHHILHSLAIARFFTPADGTSFLDMGTGGGFPGIPLAIMFPRCHFHLIDRIGKKIKVAATIAEEIKLSNVTFQHGDIGECHQQYDFVVSRAVMPLSELLPLIRKNIASQQHNAVPNGLICLKGGNLSDEIKQAKAKPLIEEITTYFDEEYFATKQLVYVPVAK